LKLYAAEAGNLLFTNDPLAEAICLQQLSGTGLAPSFCASGTHPVGSWLIYSRVPGQTGCASAAAVSQTLGRLHKSSPPVGLRYAPGGSDAMFGQTCRILDLCHGRQKTEIARLCPDRHVPVHAAPCLIHQDPVPGNIVWHAETATLIDWQCPAIGDPSEDLAVFLSPAMQYLYRGAPLTCAEQGQFLNAYPDTQTKDRFHQLRLWYHWRMAAYCLWRSQHGHEDYRAGLELELAALRRQAAKN
jgi:Ser/Thr protein kinase RdoA (MazF antagonist)